jgi:two-component system OmpR family sensor kinase
MTRKISITRRLVITVLVLELLSSVALIAALGFHERHIQGQAFDAKLMGAAQSMMGAVQDADDEHDDVLLDLRGVPVGRDVIFRVEDKDKGRVLGEAGSIPELESVPWAGNGFRRASVNGRSYRFLELHTVRIIDPGEPSGGTSHNISLIYGVPDGRVWHETVEATRFFALATLLLMGVTAGVMAWLVRRQLEPLHELARTAEGINSNDWSFSPPAEAKKTAELQPLIAALDAALARLQRSFEQQKRFTNDAAHELKTDVAIVKSSIQLLTMRRRTIEQYEQGLALSLDDFTRLEMTVQKLLTLARLEQPEPSAEGKNGVRPASSLRDAMEEAMMQNRPLAELKGIEMKFGVEGDARMAGGLQVPIDRRDAVLLCSNILHNALQHSRESGKVDIVLRVEGKEVRLTVRDRGEGIAQEDLRYIFEPFYRGDPSRSRKSGGTGLGLSICKAICDRAGGRIEVVNHPGGGALAIVSLPVVVTMMAEKPLSASINAD